MTEMPTLTAQGAFGLPLAGSQAFVVGICEHPNQNAARRTGVTPTRQMGTGSYGSPSVPADIGQRFGAWALELHVPGIRAAVEDLDRIVVAAAGRLTRDGQRRGLDDAAVLLQFAVRRRA